MTASRNRRRKAIRANEHPPGKANATDEQRTELMLDRLIAAEERKAPRQPTPKGKP